MSDRPKLQRREVMGQYLAVDPDLEDKEKHGLTLTQDGKLRVDDPTTQGKIDEALTILENAGYGNAALKLLIDAVEGKLDVPDNYKADVSALALEATLTAIKGAGWTDETLKAIYDYVSGIEAERGTDNAALPAHIDAIKQKATGPAWNQDTDSLEAIREVCDSIVTAMS